MDLVFRLLGAAMLPVVLSVVFYILKCSTGFSKLPYLAQQIIIGVAFGIVAILGTEFGIPINGATANARDAAPVCAALLFGGPAGMIAGVIGGVERWFAVYWGAGMYSRWACTFGTIIAGVGPAAARKYLFDDRRSKWDVCVLVGVFVEAIHLTLLFVTHLDDAYQAYEIVKQLAVPMIVLNAVGAGLAAFLVEIICKKAYKRHLNHKLAPISEQFQHALMIIVMIALVLSMLLSSGIQKSINDRETAQILETNVQDAKDEIEDLASEELLGIAESVAYNLDRTQSAYLPGLLARYHIAEINVVDENGIIQNSSNPDYIGFDMNSGDQAREFMCLLEGEQSYVQPFTPITYDEKDDSLNRKYAGYVLENGGFVQVGYDYRQFNDEMMHAASDLTRNRHVGRTGSIIVADWNHNIISNQSGRDEKKLADTGIEINVNTMPENTVFQADVYGVASYVLYSVKESYIIVAVYPVEEALEMRNAAIYVNSFMQLLLYAMLFFCIFVMIRKFIVEHLYEVNSSLKKITAGDLEEVVDVRNSEELDQLSDSINATVNRMKGFIAEEAARIDKELDYAKNIQHSALPSTFPAFPNNSEFDIYASMNTAKEVGGDFYDFYMLGNDRLAFLIADVSGKGIPAALFMMRAKTLIKSAAESGLPIEEVFTYANNKLCEGNDANMFVTGWLGYLDINTGHVQYVNAGHNPPLIYTEGSGYEYLQGYPGFVLAGMPGVKYKKKEFDLALNGKVFLYTDGVTEAQNINEELYGEDRLLMLLNKKKDQNPQDTIFTVGTGVDEYVGVAEQFDDITMVCVEWKGPAEKG